MTLTLQRSISDIESTQGELYAEAFFAYTLELPWHGNEEGISCVPDGEYELIPYDSPTHGATWRLHNPALNVYGVDVVPEGSRSEIELHSANWATQLKGCIALGFSDQPMLNPVTFIVMPAVEDSRDAIDALRDYLGAMSKGHTLSISSGSLQASQSA